jgi:hypothetical protein
MICGWSCSRIVLPFWAALSVGDDDGLTGSVKEGATARPEDYLRLIDATTDALRQYCMLLREIVPITMAPPPLGARVARQYVAHIRALAAPYRMPLPDPLFAMIHIILGTFFDASADWIHQITHEESYAPVPDIYELLMRLQAEFFWIAEHIASDRRKRLY